MKRYITAAFIAFAFAACKSGPPAPDTTARADSAAAVANEVTLSQEQFTNAGITTGELSSKPVNRVLKVNGAIEAPPENHHTISFPLGGYLKSDKLIPGMYVKKGALMAIMEDAAFIQLQQEYLLNRSRLHFLEADFYRQQELNKTQSNSQRTYQQAQTDYENQKITGRALAEKLRLIGIDPEKLSENNLSRSVNIYAPINGYVSKVNVNPGKYVAPTDVLFELIDPSETHASLTVFENDAAGLKKGQKVYCTITAAGNQKIPATVELITPAFNESRAVEVHCHFDGHPKDLIPGSFISAEIMLGNQDSPAVPDDAVVKWQNKLYLFTEEQPRRYKMVPVETGNSLDGFTEIKTSLPAGAKVVVTNAYTLLTMLKNAPEE